MDTERGTVCVTVLNERRHASPRRQVSVTARSLISASIEWSGWSLADFLLTIRFPIRTCRALGSLAVHCSKWTFQCVEDLVVIP